MASENEQQRGAGGLRRASEAAELEGLLRFLKAAERLKDTPRQAWTAQGRRESVAEHSWRLCLLALVLAGEYPELDLARLLGLCIVHDLAEAVGGDVPAPDQNEGEDKTARERADLGELLRPLPEKPAAMIAALWDEYAEARTPEARLAKALDKLETILQHVQGDNPADFDYRFNLDYGHRYTSDDPLILLLREMLDVETERRAVAAEAGS